MSEEFIQKYLPPICGFIGAMMMYAIVQYFDRAALKSREELEKQWILEHKS